MEILEGAHGTSLKCAENINKKGFLFGKGRAGTGVYFWAKNRYYIDLAIAWFKTELEKVVFNSLDKIVVILASFHAEKEEILDMENPKLKEKIDELAEIHGINKKYPKQIAMIYDLFVDDLEKLYNINYKILSIRVAPPKLNYCRNYPINIMGAPLCYVIRENSCIKTIELKNIK